MKYVVNFGRFWYDFIVGDSVVLAIGGAGALAEVLLPAIVIGTLAISLPLRR